jgi:predicted nucleic acid-binding protein
LTIYLDASVLLRRVLGQAGTLAEWAAIRRSVASALTEIECLRTLDRLRVRGVLGADDLAARREAFLRLLNSAEVVEPTRAILTRAAQPMPTALGTLDAIHLATALLWRESTDTELIMATHDAALGTASRAFGLPVVGL